MDQNNDPPEGRLTSAQQEAYNGLSEEERTAYLNARHKSYAEYSIEETAAYNKVMSAGAIGLSAKDYAMTTPEGIRAQYAAYEVYTPELTDQEVPAPEAGGPTSQELQDRFNEMLEAGDPSLIYREMMAKQNQYLDGTDAVDYRWAPPGQWKGNPAYEDPTTGEPAGEWQENPAYGDQENSD